MLGKGRVDEGLLSLQGLDRATARFCLIVESLIANLRKELDGCVQAQSRSSIALVKRFAQDELAAVGIVAQVELVRNSAPVADCIANCGPCCPRIHAPDHNVSAEIITRKTSRDVASRLYMNRHRFPLQTPK